MNLQNKQHADRRLAVRTDGLAKSFGAFEAVRHLDLVIPEGEMFGLVGPDGAGKSTVIRMLCGLLEPTSGTGTVAGLDLRKEKHLVKRHIGYLSQNFTLYGDLSIDENLEFFARIHGVRDFATRRDELLEFMRLKPFRSRLAEFLSGGMKKKLALACTLIHTPKIVFLDEPSTGVDPVSRVELWNILSVVLEQGLTVFMTTPYLDEAERCHRVGLMHGGKLIMTAAPDEVKRAMPGAVYDLRCADMPGAYALLRSRLPVTHLVYYGDHLRFWSARGEEDARAAIELLARGDIQGAELTAAAPSLEDAFVAFMEQDQQGELKA